MSAAWSCHAWHRRVRGTNQLRAEIVADHPEHHGVGVKTQHLWARPHKVPCSCAPRALGFGLCLHLVEHNLAHRGALFCGKHVVNEYVALLPQLP